MKKFISSHRKLLFTIFLFLSFCILLFNLLRINEYFQDKMSNEINVITQCGKSSNTSSYVDVINTEGMQEICDEVIIRSGNTSSDKLTLTCNVDWGEEIIPDMLDVLYEHDIHITFFVTGKWAEKNPQLLRSMFLKGHEIQSHGYGHKLCSQISENEVKEEITKTSDIIHGILGIDVTVFAPPSGDFDDKTVLLCHDMGLKLSLWSADTIDWREDSTAEVIHNRIMSKELKGAIILMHPKQETLKALPDIISDVKAKKLDFVTLTELISM